MQKYYIPHCFYIYNVFQSEIRILKRKALYFHLVLNFISYFCLYYILCLAALNILSAREPLRWW